MTRLAEQRLHNRDAFYRLTWRMVALVAGLSLVGIACAWLLGPTVLSILYTPEYAGYSGLLTVILAAGSLGWMGQILGFVTTSTRAFREQLFLLIVVCCTVAAVSFAAVPSLGLYGAALALGVAGVVGIGGQLLILRRSV